MSESFSLQYAPEAALAPLADVPALQGPIDSTESFNRFCREASRLWQQAHPARMTPSAHFEELAAQIEQGGEKVIRTGWGGVVIERHEHPEVEKYLVVRRGGYLALEKHEEKDEHVTVREGAGLLLWRETPGGPLTVEALSPGRRFHFPPGVEHCLIGTEHLLVYEQSTDPKGMDQDLVFIYEPVA